MATQETTVAPGQVLAQQVMWEIDLDEPERGVHRAQAILYYAPHDADNEAEHNDLVADGIPDELVDYQWETERSDYVNCIYPARRDGSFISDRDYDTRIFTSRDAAVQECVAVLRQRITTAQNAIAQLTATARGQEVR